MPSSNKPGPLVAVLKLRRRHIPGGGKVPGEGEDLL